MLAGFGAAGVGAGAALDSVFVALDSGLLESDFAESVFASDLLDSDLLLVSGARESFL